MLDLLFRGQAARAKHQRNALQHAVIARKFLLEMAQAGAGDLIHAHAAVRGGGDGPLGFYPFFFQQALERGIQRSFFNLEELVGALLDVLYQSIAMGRLTAQRLEDHHFERAGK